MTTDTQESVYWNAQAAGLVPAGSRPAELLSGLRVGSAAEDDSTDPDDVHRQSHAGAPHGEREHDTVLRIATAPAYVPYQSPRMEVYPEGERMSWSAIAVTRSRELRESVASSAVGDTTRKVVLFAKDRLWDGRSSESARALAELCGIIPGKGGEVAEVAEEYLRRGAESERRSLEAMAVRDLWGAFQADVTIRCTDWRIPDLSASLMAASMGIDYPDAPDDSGAVGLEPYIDASSEGIACLSGSAAQQAFRDSTVTCAVIQMKEEIRTELLNAVPAAGPCAVVPPASAPAPADYLVARWWDGDLPAILRLTVGWAPYRHLSTDRGYFPGSDRCGRMFRAINGPLYYNASVDLLHDYGAKEAFNELHLALASGDGRNLIGFADALAAATDEAIACDCGHDGHQVAAEIAMGACVYFALTPRYFLRRQLAALSHTAPHTNGSFLPSQEAARVTATTVLPPGNMMYSPTWTPLWRTAPEPDDTTWAEALAHRATRRYFATDQTQHPIGQRCTALTRDIIEQAACLTDGPALRSMADRWRDLFRLIATHPSMSTASNAPDPDVVEELAELVSRVWTNLIAGSHAPAAPTGESDAHLNIDYQHIVSKTYDQGPFGFALRRSLYGAVTTAIELAGHNPYARLIDGTGLACCPQQGEAVQAPTS
ncbi:hypothetical protein AB0O82_34885 [Kitasatospora sp. NPDC088264]|uniref:hypothetical protein n=1 Tax=Kitasatospora sp. NPDC088264 TaxID=3155296 RepID=UPI003421F8D4